MSIIKDKLTAEGAEGAEIGNVISGKIIGAAIEVHRELGPGLLESAYEACLAHELMSIGLRVEKQVPLPISYKGFSLENGYRMDLVVENLVVCELKTVDHFTNLHQAQLLSYLRLSGHKLGLLLNFYQRYMRNGIKRIALSAA